MADNQNNRNGNVGRSRPSNSENDPKRAESETMWNCQKEQNACQVQGLNLT